MLTFARQRSCAQFLLSRGFNHCSNDALRLIVSLQKCTKMHPIFQRGACQPGFPDVDFVQTIPATKSAFTRIQSQRGKLV